MLESSKLVLKACKSFKLPAPPSYVGGGEINDEIKNVGINEIKSSSFSDWIVASNERLEDWTEDETVAAAGNEIE